MGSGGVHGLGGGADVAEAPVQEVPQAVVPWD